MNNKKISIVRDKLDKLDYRLLSLIKKRTVLVNQVIKIKTRSSPLEAVFIRTKHYATHKQHPYCQYHLLTKKGVELYIIY